MKRVFAIVLTLTVLAAGSVAAQPKGALQLGAGMATANGSPTFEAAWDVFTIHAAGMFFPTSCSALIVDFSLGLPQDYKQTSPGSEWKLTTDSSYLDFMFGACKHLDGGGFFYVSAGLAVGWAGVEVSDSEDEYTVDTGVGFVVGAGAQVPLRGGFAGFAGLRQRNIRTQFIDDDTSIDLNIGGFEMVAGVAIAFGGGE
jgi:hypothetical protein